MPVRPSSFGLYRGLQPYRHAYLQARLIGPLGVSVVVATLLDTGAAYSVFDDALAVSVGFNTTGLPSMTVTLASGGTASMPYLTSVNLQIEAHTVPVARLLLTNVSATPLLCPQDVITATQFALDATNLYFD